MDKVVREEVGRILCERARWEWDIKVENYRRRNLLCEKGQILFTGSSLMESFPVVEMAQGSGCKYKIYNRGISGYALPQFIDNIGVMLLDLEPSKIFVNIGTNDLSAANYTLSAFVSNYAKVLDAVAAKLPDARVYVMAYYPMNENCGTTDNFGMRTNLKIDEANDALRKLAASYANCTYIDVNEGLRDGDGNLKAGFTIDGIHLHDDAYAVVYKNLLPYIVEA